LSNNYDTHLSSKKQSPFANLFLKSLMSFTCFLLFLVGICTVQSLQVSWNVSTSEYVRSLYFTIPIDFETLAVSPCIDQVMINATAPRTLLLRFDHSCAPSVTVTVDVGESTSAPVVTPRINVWQESLVVASLGQHGNPAVVSATGFLRDTKQGIEWLTLHRNRQNVSISRQIDQVYETTSGMLIRPRVRILDRRLRAPLSTQFVCQSDLAGLSVWSVSNEDAIAPHTFATINHQLLIVPPNDTMYFSVDKTAPFSIREKLGTWIGDHRWGDGLLTQQSQVFPARAPISKTLCVCGLNIACQEDVYMRFVASRLMLVLSNKGRQNNNHALPVVETTPLIQSTVQTQSTTIFGSVSGMSLINTVLLIVTIVLFTMGMFAYIRYGAGVSSNPYEERVNKYKYGDVNQSYDDADLREIERERVIAQNKAKAAAASSDATTSETVPLETVIETTGTKESEATSNDGPSDKGETEASNAKRVRSWQPEGPMRKW
jgi:hypothetical protein